MLEQLLKGTKRYEILQGNALKLLRSLPADIIQCCVTSPPYWGLRSYGTEPQEWGGTPDCTHEWELTAPRRLRSEKDVKNPNTIQKHNVGANHALDFTKTCTKCGCWHGELGHEPTPEQFVANLTDIFKEVRRVLRPDGVCWINIADSYHSNSRKRVPGGARKPQDEPLAYRGKNMALVPQKLAISLQEDGWYVRSEVIWHKKSTMPESTSDRCTRAHEQIWMVTKEANYFYNMDAIREPHKEDSIRRIHDSLDWALEGTGEHINTTQEPGKFCHPAGANKRDVWSLSHTQFEGEHYAGFPLELPRICIAASTSENGGCAECGTPYVGDKKNCKCETDKTLSCIVLDPFNGSGTTGVVALQMDRRYVGLELKEEYVKMTEQRFNGGSQLLEMMNV
jgi:DNA modification methylase